ncbi:unnamed protein product, partial [Adineta steineri]
MSYSHPNLILSVAMGSR